MKPGRAAGVDSMPAELLKAIGKRGINFMWKIWNDVWTTRNWPEDWMKRIVLPFPKKGDIPESSNYCTISLILHRSKVQLLIIQDGMKWRIKAELTTKSQNLSRNWKMQRIQSPIEQVFLSLLRRVRYQPVSSEDTARHGASKASNSSQVSTTNSRPRCKQL